MTDSAPTPTDSGSPLALERFTLWLAQGERGLSAEAIVSRLTGVKVGRGTKDHPHDPSDYLRCQKLIAAVPEVRDHLHLMRDVSGPWSRLIDNWDLIGETIERDRKALGWRSPAGCALILALISAGGA